MTSSNKSIFLDVDSSIVENNLRFTNDQEDEFNKIFATPDQMPSKLILPSPGFCVKTHEVGSESKFFVNICTTDDIPPPKDISEDELKEIIESEDSSYKVPMSIGEIRMDKDKKNVEAKVCDIAINTKFFKKIQNNQLFKNFFMSLAFYGIENKFNLICTDEKIILLNRKVFGTLQKHRIQQREIREKMKESEPQKSLIEELTRSNSGDKGKPLIEMMSNSDSGMRQPEYVLYKKKSGQNCLYGEFQLPDIISADELTLDIGEDRILLESKTKSYLLDIYVSYLIRQENCTSSFNKSTKVLTLTMPLLGG